jgi:hypothetical protein
MFSAFMRLWGFCGASGGVFVFLASFVDTGLFLNDFNKFLKILV